MPHRQHHQEGPSEDEAKKSHHHHKGEEDADEKKHHHPHHQHHSKEEQCEGHEHKHHGGDKKHHGGHDQAGHKKAHSAEAAEEEASSRHHDKHHGGKKEQHKSKGGARQDQRRKTIHDEEYKNLSHRELLRKLAYETMEAKEIYTEFSEESVAELEGIKKEYELHQTEADWKAAGYKDQRSLLWVSIDNDDSRDLDQLSTAFYDDKKRLHVLVSIADVDHLVHYQTAIDRHAEHNSTSVYTPAKVFTMLPELLSFDLTSLNQGVDRRSVVVDMTFENPDSGVILEEEIYLSVAHNQAKLAYPSVGAWIEQDGGDVPPPAPIADRKDLQENILIQDRVAQALLARRLESGALEFDKREGVIKWDGDSIKEITLEKRNRATMLIENLMIAANGASSRFLEKHGLSTLQRVVRDPERWELLQTLAKKLGGHLPDQPQSKALQLFLNTRRKADPDTFPDLSLEVIKLMGRGEYCYQSIGEEHEGHFGLAVLDYTHTTAPNRRFPDLITQRLLKSILMKTESPYNEARMQDLAKHVTFLEGETTKIERQLRKSACAILLQDKIGQEYDGIITGASSKGTYVRIFDPPVEGRVIKRASGCSVGNKVKVKLHEVDVIKGHIDFERLKEKKVRHQQDPETADDE